MHFFKSENINKIKRQAINLEKYAKCCFVREKVLTNEIEKQLIEKKYQEQII